MKTIFNVGLGLALAFCIFYFVSGKLDERIDAAVEKAVNEHLGSVEQEAVTEEAVPVSKPVNATAKPTDNREYIEVRSSKGKAKIYIGQPKNEVLELLGTPDRFDFGGSSESCTYEVGNDWFILRFRDGKLKEVDKY